MNAMPATKETQSHTPGPWQACKEGACTCGQVWSLPGDMPVFYALQDGKRQIVGLACNEWGDAPDLIYGAVGREQQIANSRLIAASPELAAALRRALDWLSSYPGGNAAGAYMDAVNALKKAGCYE